MYVCGAHYYAEHAPHTASLLINEERGRKRGSMERYYSFKLISYLSEESIKECLRHKDISHYCYILHDKDVNDDGTPKETHYHILVTVKQQKSLESIRRMFDNGSGINTLAKVIEDIVHDVRYLTHMDDPQKYQYEKSSIVTDGTDYWSKVAKDQTIDNGNEAFINDLCNPSISYKEMALRYGRDYMKNYRAYHQFAEAMLKDEWMRGNMSLEYMTENPLIGDLKMKYSHPEWVKEKDDTVYSWDGWRERHGE